MRNLVTQDNICPVCLKGFVTIRPLGTKHRKFCSKECRVKSPSCGLTKKGGISWNKGRPFTEKEREKMSLSKKGKMKPNSGTFGYGRLIAGPSHWKYISDRTKIKTRDDRRDDPLYKEWRKKVYTRDLFLCRISNSECSGKISAHHILSWRDFVELRYNINNGITLCHVHHPKKWAEEKRLIPTFQELVSVSRL